MSINITARHGRFLMIGSGVLSVLACLWLAGCQWSGTTTGKVDNGKALARTVSMLRRGEGTNTLYRVLFYGQSITSTRWTDLAAKNIAYHYPNTNFEFVNLAIGGNAASLLKRSVARDIDDIYPDLVVFHDYGGEQDYEDIIKAIRSRSAAEVILQTDHLTTYPEPLCPTGLNIKFSTPPGCTGNIWLHQRHWDDYMSGSVIPRIAVRYGAAIDPRRTGWIKYIGRHRLEPSQLLQDEIHPNAEGWRLAASLFTEFLRNTIRSSETNAQGLTNIIPANNHPVKQVRFEGNRLEIISSRPLSQSLEVTIDGIPSKSQPGCWIPTRVSSVPWIPEWPALRQITLSNHRLEPDEWTIKLDQFNDNLTDFRFRLYSKLHGFDGEGRGQNDFVSNSGSVKIIASDWVLGNAMQVKPVAIPRTMNLRWSRKNVCGYRPDNQAKVSPVEYHYIAATGITNSQHVAVIKSELGFQTRIKSFIAYKPWLT